MKNMIGSSGVLRGSDVVYRPITLADFTQFYGYDRPIGTISGFSFLRDGQVVGVAGIEMRKGVSYAFSDIRGEAEGVTIWRAALLVRDWMLQRGIDVYACANEQIEGAGGFLQRLGFRKIGEYYVMRTSGGDG